MASRRANMALVASAFQAAAGFLAGPQMREGKLCASPRRVDRSQIWNRDFLVPFESGSFHLN
jgi:hypothetical protein